MIELTQTNVLSRQISERLQGDARPQGTGDFFRGSWTMSCPRWIWWEQKSEPYSEVASACGVEKMNKGTRYGIYFQNELIQNNTDYILACCEEELEEDLGGVKIRGHIDGILLDKKTLKPAALFEAKTTSAWGFKGTAKGFGDPDHYSWSYIKQSTRYLAMWNRKHPEAILDTICVFVYNVNGDLDTSSQFCARDWWFKPSQEDFDNDIAFLREVWNAKRLPRKGYETKKDCPSFCPYLSKCWEPKPKKEPASDPFIGLVENP